MFFSTLVDRTGTTFLPLFSSFFDRTGPPPDVPECGFDGGLCERDSQVRRAGKNLMMKMKKYIEIQRNVKKFNQMYRKLQITGVCDSSHHCLGSCARALNRLHFHLQAL